MNWKTIVGIICLLLAWKGPKTDVTIEWPDLLGFFNKPAVVDVIPTPNSSLMGLVNNIKSASATVSSEDKIVISKFYRDFANVLQNDELVTDTVRLRTAYSLAGKTLFGTSLKGKYPSLGAAIDKELIGVLGNSATKLDRNKTVEALNAVAYAFGD